MQQKCLIYNNSLRFSRAVYGGLSLIAFLTQNHWIILPVSFLMILGAFSIKFNILYQFHVLVLRELLKERTNQIRKEAAEINFVSGMTGALLFIGFLLLYYDKFVNFAWIFILIVVLLIFLACLSGVCVASLMYALFKKIFKGK